MTAEQVRTRERQDFVEVVIDVGVPDNWSRLNLQRIGLSTIPGFTTEVVDDMGLTFVLHPEVSGMPQKQIEAKFDPNWIAAGGEPRTIVLPDGRLFIRQDMICDTDYLRIMLPPLMERARGYFESKELEPEEAAVGSEG